MTLDISEALIPSL